jgi:hypothetical protein
MLVCVHGNVAEYCKAKGLTPVEVWTGELSEYRGKHSMLVTDADISKHEYYYLKCEYLTRGIVLLSTRYEDDEDLMEYIEHFAERNKEKRRGRQPFGLRVRDGKIVKIPREMVVVRRILELYDEGWTLRAISDDESVRRPDGSYISIGTINNIIKNRRKYEDGE